MSSSLKLLGLANIKLYAKYCISTTRTITTNSYGNVINPNNYCIFTVFKMAEEEDDQDSSFDEPHAEEPIKVSVTFKSRNQEAEVKLLDNSESSHSVHRDESPSGNPSKLNASCHDRETKDTRLAVNQYESSIPSQMIDTGKDKKRVPEEDALKVHSSSHKRSIHFTIKSN